MKCNRAKRLTQLILLSLLCSNPAYAVDECVIMVHGMWRTSNAMTKIAMALRSQGYFVVNESYPTNRFTIQEIAENYLPNYVSVCEQQHSRKIHFVTHSIGGVIVRAYLQNHTLPTGTRIVMLAPPNHGSKLADQLHNSFVYQHVMGPMGKQLQTGKDGFTHNLPENIPAEVGIITGNASLNPVASSLLGEEGDGKVSVKSARVGGMKDFMVVPSSHTFIMFSPKVVRATVQFIATGSFKQANSPT